LRKLSLLAAVPLLFGVARLGSISCLAQSGSVAARAHDEAASSDSMDSNRSASLSALSVLGKLQPFSMPGPLADVPSERIHTGRMKKPGRDNPRLGIGLKISSLGAGVEAATSVTRRTNARFGFNTFNFSRGFSEHGINYAGRLYLQSLEFHYDWFPPLFRAFHLSPGLLAYNDNRVTAIASVPGGQTFTLNGVPFMSDPLDPIHGNAKLNFNQQVAPTFLFGWGNLLPRGRRHFSLNIEAGAAYQGSPRLSLILNGSACDPLGLNCRNAGTDPGVQAYVQAEQARLVHNLRYYKFYPLLSVSIGYKIH
jgi:hypothetical protein